jgi:hypothetical protein
MSFVFELLRGYPPVKKFQMLWKRPSDSLSLDSLLPAALAFLLEF